MSDAHDDLVTQYEDAIIADRAANPSNYLDYKGTDMNDEREMYHPIIFKDFLNKADAAFFRNGEAGKALFLKVNPGESAALCDLEVLARAISDEIDDLDEDEDATGYPGRRIKTESGHWIIELAGWRVIYTDGHIYEFEVQVSPDRKGKVLPRTGGITHSVIHFEARV